MAEDLHVYEANPRLSFAKLESKLMHTTYFNTNETAVTTKVLTPSSSLANQINSLNKIIMAVAGTLNYSKLPL